MQTDFYTNCAPCHMSGILPLIIIPYHSFSFNLFCFFNPLFIIFSNIYLYFASLIKFLQILKWTITGHPARKVSPEESGIESPSDEAPAAAPTEKRDEKSRICGGGRSEYIKAEVEKVVFVSQDLNPLNKGCSLALIFFLYIILSLCLSFLCFVLLCLF